MKNSFFIKIVLFACLNIEMMQGSDHSSLQKQSTTQQNKKPSLFQSVYLLPARQIFLLGEQKTNLPLKVAIQALDKKEIDIAKYFIQTFYTIDKLPRKKVKELNLSKLNFTDEDFDNIDWKTCRALCREVYAIKVSIEAQKRMKEDFRQIIVEDDNPPALKFLDQISKQEEEQGG